MEKKQEDNNILGNHMLNQTFFEKYKLVKKLGEGSFGMIFKAQSPEGCVAFKFEKKRPNKRSLLKDEAQIMMYLKGKGIPSIILYQEEENYNIMIMELLGKSLESLLKDSQNNRFNLKTICLLGIELVPILQFIHDRHIIHRDIKPDNFAIGYGDPCQIYILDFGLAKKYRSSKTLQQNPMVKHAKLTGTARYASINALKGFEQSRRDDMESLGYVLTYLIKGNLPWQGIAAKTKEEKYAKILNKKINVTSEKLLKNEPKELMDYLNYCKNLKYEDEPDYDYLTGLFKNIITNKLKDKIDYLYDWVNNTDAESHIKLTNGYYEISRTDNSSLVNNINGTSNETKNITGVEEKEPTESQIKENKEKKLSYYDNVIDEILINKDDNQKDKIDDYDKKDNTKEKKHGQCCLII